MNAEWRERAACRGMDPDIFFPHGTPQKIARETCDGCPVNQECLDDALEDERLFPDSRYIVGIRWLTARERKDIINKERLPFANMPDRDPPPPTMLSA